MNILLRIQIKLKMKESNEEEEKKLKINEKIILENKYHNPDS